MLRLLPAQVTTLARINHPNIVKFRGYVSARGGRMETTRKPRTRNSQTNFCDRS